MRRIGADAIVALLLLVVCAELYRETYNFRVPPFETMSTGTWPRLILVALAALSIIMLVQSLLSPAPVRRLNAEGEAVVEPDKPVSHRNALICFGMFAAFLASLHWLGMLIAGALVFNYVITSENIPTHLSGMLKGMEMTPMVFLLLVNAILLVLGAFLEGSTIILIILPVLLPTAVALGIDPVHFGVMAVLNIMIGLVTPPYGLLLFMMMKIANVSFSELMAEVWPYLLVMLAALGLVTFWPGMVLWLPRLAGYTG